MEHAFIFDMPLLTKPEPKPIQYVEVRLQFKDSQLVETVNFQSFNVFKFIADDVAVIRWKHVSDLDGVKDILSEGSNFDSMGDYFSQLEADARKAKKNKR